MRGSWALTQQHPGHWGKIDHFRKKSWALDNPEHVRAHRKSPLILYGVRVLNLAFYFANPGSTCPLFLCNMIHAFQNVSEQFFQKKVQNIFEKNYRRKWILLRDHRRSTDNLHLKIPCAPYKLKGKFCPCFFFRIFEKLQKCVIFRRFSTFFQWFLQWFLNDMSTFFRWDFQPIFNLFLNFSFK